MKQPLRWALALAALAIVLAATGCMSTPQAGEIGVVRNGGPFDNHNIRQIVDNGSGNTWVGWYSQTHYYPVDSQQRFFKMESCRNDQGAVVACKGADAPGVVVPTSDGVDVTVEGTFYLNTVFNNSGPKKCSHQSTAPRCALEAFDTQFATRTFNGKHAYDGTDGWSHFLAAIVEPIVANNLRETISGVTCAELVSSCALVQNTNASASARQLAQKNNRSNVSRVQGVVEKGLATDLLDTLRHAYFKNIKFNLKVVKLPGRVQTAVNDAQAAFAQVSKAQARIRSARADASANQIRQRGYNRCPTCARIDAIRALPRGVTALGGNFAIGVK